jgi:hypothetical protein
VTTIPIKLFGDFLLNRENGKQAYDVLKRDYFLQQPNELFLLDFTGVKVLAPSYCDEVFGQLTEEYPDKIRILEPVGDALKAAFNAVQETRGVHFVYQPAASGAL